MLQFETQIISQLKNIQKVAVGVSGGADSMVLLSLLQAYAQSHSLEMVVVHVEHGVRKEDSLKDAHFVQEYCQKQNIPCIVEHVNAPAYAKEKGLTLEQACRELRYQVFHNVMQQQHISYLVLAHHADDQLETVLMHICRGSGLRGALGMQQQQGYILRPLLPFTKQEIVNYAQENAIAYCEDITNQDTEYTRNYIRKNVVPALTKLYPTLHENMARFTQNLGQDAEFIESQVPYFLLRQEKQEIHIPKSVSTLPYSLASRVIYRAFSMLKVYQDIEQKHILLVLSALQLKPGNKLDLPWNTELCVGYEDVVLRMKTVETKTEIFVPFQVGVTTCKQAEITIEKQTDEVVFGENVQYVDAFKIPTNAVWRTKQPGDVFQKLGAGTKKLVDYFTDKKIERYKRENCLLLASGNEILLVAGLDISDKVKIDAQTEEILAIHYKWIK